jgi:hypothetical protein
MVNKVGTQVNTSTGARYEEGYFALMHRLADFWKSLRDRPTVRELQGAVGVGSPATVQAWLGGEHFPKQLDQLLRLVDAIRAAARARGIDVQGLGDLLDEDRWRGAYRKHAQRLAAGSGAAVGAALGRDALSRDSGPPGRADYQAMARLRAALPAPYPPNEFVARPDVQQRVLDALLQPPPPGRGRVIALAGMSGAGKTVLAEAIVLDEQVRDRFAGGVLWLELNRDLPSTFWRDQMLGMLGEEIPVDTRLASALLRTRLNGARCLIVLNDASAVEQIEPVNVVGPDSALLVTAQNEALLAGMEICRVAPCEPGTSLELLAKYSGQELVAPPPEAREVLESCGGLALALAICGAMVRDDHQWSDVADLLHRAAFDQLEITFAGYIEKPSLLAALQVGVSSLTADDQKYYDALAVFARRGPVPVRAASVLWGLDLSETRRKIVYFARRSVLTYQADVGVFRLHDLLSRYVVSRAGNGLPAMHRQLADAYLESWGGIGSGLSNTGPGDDYGMMHLAHHLDMAGRDDLLHQVLAAERPTSSGTTENTWFAVHDRAGRTTQYLADLDLAWRRAEDATDRSAAAEERARNRALEMRYALAKSSVTGIAANVPPPLMAALVQHGLRSFTDARMYSATLPTPSARASALAALARLPDEFGIDRDLLLAEARTAADAVEEADHRAWALARLIPCAPDADRPGLFEAVMQAADEAQFKSDRAWILVRLAPHVPGLVRGRLADIGAGIHVTEMVEALLLVAPHIPEVRDDLPAAARRLHGLAGNQVSLVKAACLVPEPERARLITGAQESIAGMSERPAHVRSGPGVSGLVETLLDIQGHGGLKADLLIALLPLVSEAERPTLVAAAIPAVREAGPEIDPETLAAVLPHIPDAERDLLVDEVLGPDPYVSTRCAIAPYLSPQLLALAVDHALALASESLRTRAFQALAPWMPPTLLHHAWRSLSTSGLDTPEDRGHALVRLVDRIPSGQQAAALAMVATVRDPEMRAALLFSVAPFVAPPLIQATCDVIPPEAEPRYRALILTQLAMRCGGAQRARLLARAVEAALSSSDPQAPLRELPNIAADPWQLWNVLLLQEALGGETGEVDFGDLARRLPPGTLDRAVHDVREVTDQCYRSCALARLATCASGALRGKLLKEALDAACASHDHSDGTRCDISASLAEAVRCVPEHEREELPADYLKQMADRNRANAAKPLEDGFGTDEDAEIRQLICVLTYLPEGKRKRTAGQAMRELRHHRHERDQVVSLVALAPFLTADHSEELVRLAEAFPESADRVDPLVAVARYAPERERPAILATALAAKGTYARLWPSHAPIMVAPYFPELRRLRVFQDALGRIAAMDEGEAQAEEIATLAPHLPAKLLGETVKIVGMIRVPKARADARRSLAKAVNCADPENWRFWRSALADAVAVDRSTVLSLAVDACLAAGGDESGGETEPTATHLAEAILATLRWWPGGSQSHKTGMEILGERVAERMVFKATKRTIVL